MKHVRAIARTIHTPIQEIFFKYPNTTFQNTFVCPAVNVVLEKLREVK